MKKRDEALAAERIRQRGLDREAEAINLGSRQRYDDFGEQQDERGSQLGEYFREQNIESAPSEGEVTRDFMPQSGSSITVRNEQQQRGQARDFTDAQAMALGNLRSFGDLLGGIGREQARDAGLIGQIGGFKRGSSSIVPLELEEASRAGDGMKFFGDLLGMGGGLSLNAGLGGGTLFGQGPFPKAPTDWSKLQGLF